MSAVLTALIIAVIIVINVIFSALAQKFLWYGDLTPELLFTMSDDALSILEVGDEKFGSKAPIERVNEIREENRKYNAEKGLTEGMAGYKDEDIKISIIFCDDPDVIESNINQKYVYRTALELEEKFPDYIEVINYDIVRNPSSVSRFKANSLSEIYTTSVIVEFGTEYRVRELRSFFMFEEADGDTPWAYNGEKAFVSSILAVTRAESPLALLTVNHGESTKDSALEDTLWDAGYEVRYIDLAEQDIPEKCRLLVIMDPKQDFLVADGVSDIDEIKKLDEYLDKANAMMVFMDPSTARLNNLEEYLEEWGISFDRTTVGTTEVSHLVTDKSQSLTSDGYTFFANYAEGGIGAGLTKDMRSRPAPQKIVFANAMSISYSDVYEPAHYTPDAESTAADDIEYDYGSYRASGTFRSIYDVFVSSPSAEAYAGNMTSPIEQATAMEPLRLMTVSTERRIVTEDNYSTIDETSYVFACGSTEFVSSAMLNSNSYGNTDFLLTAMRAAGREPVPVGLKFKPFADFTIDTMTTSEATQYTVVLAVVPMIIATVVGAVVIIRRKHR